MIVRWNFFKKDIVLWLLILSLCVMNLSLAKHTDKASIIHRIQRDSSTVIPASTSLLDRQQLSQQNNPFSFPLSFSYSTSSYNNDYNSQGGGHGTSQGYGTSQGSYGNSYQGQGLSPSSVFQREESSRPNLFQGQSGFSLPSSSSFYQGANSPNYFQGQTGSSYGFQGSNAYDRPSLFQGGNSGQNIFQGSSNPNSFSQGFPGFYFSSTSPPPPKFSIELPNQKVEFGGINSATINPAVINPSYPPSSRFLPTPKPNFHRSFLQDGQESAVVQIGPPRFQGQDGILLQGGQMSPPVLMGAAEIPYVPRMFKYFEAVPAVGSELDNLVPN